MRGYHERASSSTKMSRRRRLTTIESPLHLRPYKKDFVNVQTHFPIKKLLCSSSPILPYSPAALSPENLASPILCNCICIAYNFTFVRHTSRHSNTRSTSNFVNNIVHKSRRRTRENRQRDPYYVRAPFYVTKTAAYVVVKNIARKHRGEVTIRASANKGRFTNNRIPYRDAFSNARNRKRH